MFEILFILMILNFYFIYKGFCSHTKWEGAAFILYTMALHMSVADALINHFDHVTYTHCQGKEILTSISGALSVNKVWPFCIVLALGVFLEKSWMISAEFILRMCTVCVTVDYDYNLHMIFTYITLLFLILKTIVYYQPLLHQITIINYTLAIIMVISFISHNIYKCGDYTYSIFCFAELLWLQSDMYWNYKRRAIMNTKVNIKDAL